MPKNLFEADEAAVPGVKRDAIRERLTAQLGRVLQFKMDAGRRLRCAGPVVSVVADVLHRRTATSLPTSDEEEIDLTELTDLAPADAAVDSVGLLTSQFDATVVEELPRD